MKARCASRFCIVLALGALPCTGALAEIYKCIDGSRISYQDQPCGDAAAAKTFTPTDTRGITPITGVDDEKSARPKPFDEFSRDRRSREIVTAIDRAERDLRDYDGAEASEIAALRDKRRYNETRPSTLPSEIQLRQIDEEIESTAQRYKALRQAARERIAQLRRNAADLDAPLIVQ